ncbi:hypothetical protein Tco_0716434 [Tanacetum coccineum]
MVIGIQNRGQGQQENKGRSASQRRSETLPPPPLCTTCGKPHPGTVYATTRDQAAKDFRTVIFGNVRQPEFVYHGSSPLKSVKLISAMKARTLISHGCQGFLASVMDTSLESPNIENLSIVREFADVFPDELPGLFPPLERLNLHLI